MAIESDQKVPKSAADTDDHKPEEAPTAAQDSSWAQSASDKDNPALPAERLETGTPPVSEQRSTDRETDPPSDSLEQLQSHGNFTNLAEEFEARAKSRAQAKALDSKSEENKPDDGPRIFDLRVDGRPLRESIDPESEDANAAGSAEGGLGPLGDRVATSLDEGENDTRSRADKFRTKVHAGSENLLDKVTSSVNKGVEAFGPRPTGQETRIPHSGPDAGEIPHSGIDAGTASAGVLALGILGSELIRKIRKARWRGAE